jgi:hypothetical protein
MNKDLLVVTVPFTYTFGPSLAPALLKATVESTGKYTCDTWDLSADFNFYCQKHEYYEIIIACLYESIQEVGKSIRIWKRLNMVKNKKITYLCPWK